MAWRFLDLIGSELAIVWDDGHESYYPLEQLRRHCPCAVCSGEPDLFGNVARGPAPRYTDESFEATSVERVGNYGLQIGWKDGHPFGIWTLERLRSLCPCPTCNES
ncbi:MAG TPA: DUF971 domain-containing protein [Thermoanaerobaculia bacterium]|nr:DUF971 domain-containing protein [Thermoanaerobaculia bacterium]